MSEMLTAYRILFNDYLLSHVQTRVQYRPGFYTRIDVHLDKLAKTMTMDSTPTVSIQHTVTLTQNSYAWDVGPILLPISFLLNIFFS